MRGKKTVTGLIITFISLLIIASIVYYSRLFVPNTLKAGNYSTETVQRGQVVSATIATGVVEPENEVLVLSPAAGIIQTIVAEPGNRVKKNDIIGIRNVAEKKR